MITFPLWQIAKWSKNRTSLPPGSTETARPCGALSTAPEICAIEFLPFAKCIHLQILAEFTDSHADRLSSLFAALFLYYIQLDRHAVSIANYTKYPH